jgi:transaldolase
MYVTELVVPNTVNSMPERTLLAFAEHGEMEGDKVTGTALEAPHVLDTLSGVDISYQEVVAALEADGVEKFIASWDELVHTVSSALATAR